MCKRMMPHFQKAATQLRGHFVSEAHGPGRAGWLSRKVVGGGVQGRGRGRAGLKIVSPPPPVTAPVPCTCDPDLSLLGDKNSAELLRPGESGACPTKASNAIARKPTRSTGGSAGCPGPSADHQGSGMRGARHQGGLRLLVLGRPVVKKGAW